MGIIADKMGMEIVKKYCEEILRGDTYD